MQFFKFLSVLGAAIVGTSALRPDADAAESIKAQFIETDGAYPNPIWVPNAHRTLYPHLTTDEFEKQFHINELYSSLNARQVEAMLVYGLPYDLVTDGARNNGYEVNGNTINDMDKLLKTRPDINPETAFLQIAQAGGNPLTKEALLLGLDPEEFNKNTFSQKNLHYTQTALAHYPQLTAKEAYSRFHIAEFCESGQERAIEGMIYGLSYRQVTAPSYGADELYYTRKIQELDPNPNRTPAEALEKLRELYSPEPLGRGELKEEYQYALVPFMQRAVAEYANSLNQNNPAANMNIAPLPGTRVVATSQDGTICPNAPQQQVLR